MYTMRFYDVKGNTAGEVNGLTMDEVKTIYRGCMAILKAEGNSIGFNAWMPTVWKDGERVNGF